MNCEKRDQCPIAKQHGDKLCQRLYCLDMCPAPRDIQPGANMSKAAKGQKGNE